MIEPHYAVDLTGLTKCRKPRMCNKCGRNILKREHYWKFQQQGETVWCILCVTRHQMVQKQLQVNDMEAWLSKRIGENT